MVPSPVLLLLPSVLPWAPILAPLALFLPTRSGVWLPSIRRLTPLASFPTFVSLDVLDGSAVWDLCDLQRLVELGLVHQGFFGHVVVVECQIIGHLLGRHSECISTPHVHRHPPHGSMPVGDKLSHLVRFVPGSECHEVDELGDLHLIPQLHQDVGPFGRMESIEYSNQRSRCPCWIVCFDELFVLIE